MFELPKGKASPSDVEAKLATVHSVAHLDVRSSE
jgi:hypothetical protein